MKTSYNIIDIRKAKPEDRLYFFDANIWLFIIDRATNPTKRELPYLEFWDNLTALSSGEKKVVAVNSTLVSEILNTFLRIKFKSYQDELIQFHNEPATKVRELKFKVDYRSTQRYKDDILQFSSEFAAYSYYIQFLNDSSDKIDLVSLLEEMPSYSDFNDFFYYKFCIHYNLPIITDDGDFRFKNLPIITANNNLLKIRS
ncbi:hypothetical protein ACFFMH_07720 [Rufibacter immobilis]